MYCEKVYFSFHINYSAFKSSESYANFPFMSQEDGIDDEPIDI